MSSPRFRPNRYLKDPWQFGRSTTPNWRVAPGGNEHELIAAALQHANALAVSAAIRSKFRSRKTFAENAPISYDLLGGVLRGDDILRVEHQAIFARYLGATAVVPPDIVNTCINQALRAVPRAKKTPATGGPLSDDLFGAFDPNEPRPAPIGGAYHDALLDSAWDLAEAAGLDSGWSDEGDPDTDLTVEAPPTAAMDGYVYGAPTKAGALLTVYLGEKWTLRKNTDDTYAIGNHALTAVRSVDKHGRPRKVRAIRLLQVPDGDDSTWEYTASLATIDWTDTAPTLTWDQPDDVAAAQQWLEDTGRSARP